MVQSKWALYCFSGNVMGNVMGILFPQKTVIEVSRAIIPYLLL